MACLQQIWSSSGQDFWLTDEKAGGEDLRALARHIVTWASSIPQSPWPYFKNPSCNLMMAF